jgi:CheY-like chemotaxis protein
VAAAALATIKLGDEREIDLHANIKVLLVDDDPHFLNTAREYLEEVGCEVHAVTETEEAARSLLNDSYDIIIADLNFDPPQQVQGAQFIEDNKKHMGDAKVVAVTGQNYYAFKTRPELKRLGVDVIDKGEALFEDLNNITADKVEEQRQGVVERIRAALSDIGHDVGVSTSTRGGGAATAAALARAPEPAFRQRPSAALEHLYVKLEGMLTRWLRSLPDPDEKVISTGDHHTSVNELILNIEEGTELGLAQMDMLIDQFKHMLRLEDE